MLWSYKNTMTQAHGAADAGAGTRMCCALFSIRGMHTHTSWYGLECLAESDTEEKKLLNKVMIFVFFLHKNILVYSFISWTILSLSLLRFWAFSSVAVYAWGQKAFWFHQKYLNLCTKDELTEGLQKEQHEGGVINDRIFILGKLSFLGLAFNAKGFRFDPKWKFCYHLLTLKLFQVSFFWWTQKKIQYLKNVGMHRLSFLILWKS